MNGLIIIIGMIPVPLWFMIMYKNGTHDHFWLSFAMVTAFTT